MTSNMAAGRKQVGWGPDRAYGPTGVWNPEWYIEVSDVAVGALVL